MVCFSILIGCIQSIFSINSSHHSQLIWACVATYHGRHNLPAKSPMHHCHVVAGHWSCSIPPAQRERKVEEGEGGQEDHTEGHLVLSMSIQLCMCIYIDTSNDISIMWNMSSWLTLKLDRCKFLLNAPVLAHICKALNSWQYKGNRHTYTWLKHLYN